MTLAGVGLSASEAALLLALMVRRLGQVWRRAEQDTPENWLTYSDRIGPECLPDVLKNSAIGREALTLAAAQADKQNVGSKQAVVILADALAAGFGWGPGQKPELDSLAAATAALPAGVGGDGAGEELFWPLTSRAQTPQPLPEGKLLKADPGDPGNVYRALWLRVKAALQKLPGDGAGLPAGLVQVLREVDNVPVPLAVGDGDAARFAGMTDVVMTAWPLASSLWRTLSAVPGRMDDSAAAWYSTDEPLWTLAAVRLEAAVAPRNVDDVAGLFAAQGKAMQHLRDGVAKALGRDSLTAAMLGAPSTGDELWLLDAAAADAVKQTVAGLQASLAGLGLRAQVATMPLALRDLTADGGRGLAVCVNRALAAATEVGGVANPFAPRPRSAQVAAIVGAPVEPRPVAATPAIAAAVAVPVAAADTPAIARPTLAAASPQSGADDDPTDDESSDAEDDAALATQAATASSEAPPAVARLIPAASGVLAGAAPVDVTRALRRHAELAFSAANVARATGVRLVAGPDAWWVAGPASALPDAVVRLVEFWSIGWGHRPPSALLVALVAGDAAISGSAVRAATTLARRAGRGGGAVAWFPRHTSDARACFPLEDLPHVARLGMHVLNLSGLRLSADGRHHVERLGRGHEWVAGSCRRAANIALPERRTTTGAAGRAKRDGHWRANLSYSLNRYLGRRRHWSRKKAPPSPVDVLVDAISRNKWLGADRSTRLDSALYLDLAGRWVEALRPSPD